MMNRRSFLRSASAVGTVAASGKRYSEGLVPSLSPSVDENLTRMIEEEMIVRHVPGR